MASRGQEGAGVAAGAAFHVSSASMGTSEIGGNRRAVVVTKEEGGQTTTRVLLSR